MEKLSPIQQHINNCAPSYLNRCKTAAKAYSKWFDKCTTEEEQRRDQEYVANLIAETWDVEKVDMLAETNTTCK